MKLSVYLIVKNGEKYLKECLTSVQAVADEIIVVIDNQSSDKSEDIAKEFTSHVFKRTLNTFSEQKNYAQEKCTHDWVMSIDADEILSTELIKNINDLKKTNLQEKIYAMKRKNKMFGQVVHYGNWDPNPIKRLWPKSKCSWTGNVHEHVVCNNMQTQVLPGEIFHYNYDSIEQFIQKMNKYTSLEEKPQNPLKDVFRRYVWHVGFLDGWRGLFLVYLMGIYYICANIKLWQKKQLLSLD